MKGDAGGKQFNAIDPKNQDHDGKDDQGDSGPGLPDGNGAEHLPFIPDEEGREEGDKEAMRVIGDGVPVIDQLHCDPVIENAAAERR